MPKAKQEIMIQANELRIGNWVAGEGEAGKWGVHAIVHEILKDGRIYCYPDNNDPEYKNEIVTPTGIPLTPEILERCGFTTDEMGTWLDLNGSGGSYLAWNGQSVELRDSSGDPIIFKKPLQYLHQLQNLVFALTGTELPVNLTANQPA